MWKGTKETKIKDCETKMSEMCKEEREGETVERKKLKGLGQLWVEEDGMGTVEVILIIVVLVGLVLIFRKQLTDLVNKMFTKITQQADKI